MSALYDPLGNHESYTFDSGNNMTQKVDRRGYAWNNTFDGNGNVLTAKDPYNHTTTNTYSTHSRLLTSTLPLGRSVALTYDVNDNLTQVQQKDNSGVVKATTTYTVSAATYGLVTDKYDPNNHHTVYAYDANGYLASITTPLGHQTQWTYDAFGFQTSRQDAMNRTTTYTPDAWERLVTTTYPDSTTNTYAYDPNSSLTAFSNYASTFTRAYDADNRMTGEYIGTTRMIEHTYDAPGQRGLLSTTKDADGRVITYAYTSRSELFSVSEAARTTSYAYDADGNQTHLYLPNGLQTDQYYNNDGTLDSYYNWDGGSTISRSYGYVYNADHQISGYNEGTSAAVHSTPNPTTVTYGYDAQGHLTGEARTGTSPFSSVYGYDPAGNRTNLNNGGNNPMTYDTDDELKTVGGANAFTFTYNANGDRTGETCNGQPTTFAYDFDDRLTGITAGATTTAYRYDALGRQVSRSVNGTFTGYYLDGSQMLLEKQGGVNQAVYTWGNGLIRCNGEYPLTDGRGSVRLTTDAGKNITSSNVPDAFGIHSLTSGTASAYAYHGGEGYREDGVSPAGLPGAYSFQQVGDRYYDPTFGCFLTRDTDLSQDPYAYCGGDPVNFSDPTGHSKLGDALKHLWQNISSVSNTVKGAVSGGFAALGAGLGIAKLLDAYNNQNIRNQTLANERTMLDNYFNSHDNPDMTRQLQIYHNMQNATLGRTPILLPRLEVNICMV